MNNKKNSIGDNVSKEHKKFLEENRNFYLKHCSHVDAAENFPLFLKREQLIYYLSKYELYLKTLEVKGSIVECGSYKGSSLLLFAKLTSIFEPYNIHKKVLSFDTFSGFPTVNKKDNLKYKKTKKKHLNDTSLTLIKDSIKLFDLNRFNSHINKIELIQGDAIKTIPKYLKENKHTLVSLLYLDFDLYEPTKVALENFLPRIPKGGLVVFDELNEKRWYGETVAMLEKLNLNKFELKQMPHEPNISYIKI